MSSGWQKIGKEKRWRETNKTIENMNTIFKKNKEKEFT